MKKVLIIAGSLTAAHLLLVALRKKPPMICYVDDLPFGYNAMTVPPVGIFIKRSQHDNKALLDHEMIHWAQYQRMGLLGFYAAYTKGSTEGYDANPMEIEARANETDYCKLNYTTCVRNGTAKTIQDKNFKYGSK